MRTRFMIGTAALLLAFAIPASAQTQPPAMKEPAPPTASEVPPLGFLDLGFRGSDNTGDDARYGRYRDLREGAASVLQVGRSTESYLFELRAQNIGYNDQRYLANYSGNNARFNFDWTSIPLNYSFMASTPWVQTSTGVFTLDPFARAAVQNKTAGVIGVPSSASQLLSRSIYSGLAGGFDLQSQRNAANVVFAYDATRDVGFNASFTTTKKTGSQPWGASFAFNNANELPLPLDNRTNDMAAGLEWTNAKGMVRVGYDGSWFNNNIHDIVWDNPIRATSTTPYDLSGYSNGNGPAQGRMSTAPSNYMNTVSGTAMYKMPAHSVLNGTLSFTSMNQNDTLIPWTINPALASCATGCTGYDSTNRVLVFNVFPGLASLPRNTAEAAVHGVNGLLNFSTRPNSFFGLTARYRYNDRQNLTPTFNAEEYVRFDAVPEEGGGETEQFNIRQNALDVNATFNVLKYTALRVGYGYDAYNRTGRSFTDMVDNTFRTSVDTMGNRYVTVRGIYEYTQRRGSGFDQANIVDAGGQPALRYYDEADRNRNKGTVVVSVNPVDVMDLSFSFAAAKDDYSGAGTGQQFGLLDNSNTSYNVGVNVYPIRAVGFGANYGRDKYTGNQKSRNASPGAQFVDPAYDWTLANEENVNNFNAYLDLPKVIRKVDVRFNYDFSDSDNGFIFGGPRVASLTAVNQFIPLPNVTNQWQRLAADVKYYFHRQVGVGIGYWYEKFDVNDFATVDAPGQPGTPRIDYLGEISTGYGNRPYKGSTAFVRLLYNF